MICRNECVVSAGGRVASDQSSCGVVNASDGKHVMHVITHKGTQSCSVTDTNVSLLVHCLVSMMSWEPASVQMSSRVLPIESHDTMNTPFWLARLIRALWQSPACHSTAAATLGRKTRGIYLRQFGQNIKIRISVAARKRTPVCYPIILTLLMKQRRKTNA